MHLSLHPYHLPLRKPWHSARGCLHQRQGWLVVAADAGQRGYGDCAPLPDAGTETLAAAERRLTYWHAQAPHLAPAHLADALTAALPTPTPAADAAVEGALLNLHSRAAGVPLRGSLLAGAHARLSVPVNGACGALMHCEPQHLGEQIQAGFDVLKLKLGTSEPATELARLKRLLAALPAGARLRLDANGAWDFDTAQAMIGALEELGGQGGAHPGTIESLEEPLAGHGEEALRDARLAELQAGTSIALALDESLPRRSWPIRPEHLPVRRMVLKPGVLGGLRPSLALALAAHDLDVEIVITSLIDSAAGLWAAAQLAAAVDALAASREKPALCHGLATADWLAADLGAPPQIERGRLCLNTCPGGGFAPWPTALTS
jgi:o-succinylbenzoate synthase